MFCFALLIISSLNLSSTESSIGPIPMPTPSANWEFDSMWGSISFLISWLRSLNSMPRVLPKNLPNRNPLYIFCKTSFLCAESRNTKLCPRPSASPIPNIRSVSHLSRRVFRRLSSCEWNTSPTPRPMDFSNTAFTFILVYMLFGKNPFEEFCNDINWIFLPMNRPSRLTAGSESSLSISSKLSDMYDNIFIFT